MKPERGRVLAEGLIAGLVGYAAIVLFYGVANLVTGHSFFHTATELGAGLVAPDAMGGAATGAVLAFNGLHLLAFLLIGQVAAWLVFETERHPSLFVLVLFLAIGGFLLSLAAFLMLSATTEGAPSWVSVAAANLLAGAAMGGYLFHAHPRLWGEIREHLDPETEHPVPR